LKRRRVRILAQAADEAAAAAAWYESEKPGLGAEFLRAINTSIELLQSELPPLLPLARPTKTARVMRILLKRFPFELIIRELEGDYLIVAVAHQHRRPGYWRKR